MERPIGEGNGGRGGDRRRGIAEVAIGEAQGGGNGGRQRYRAWVVTVNNYGPADIENLRTLVGRGGATFVIFQEEIAPGTGTPHLQAYVRFAEPKDFGRVRNILFSGEGLVHGHIAGARGSVMANIEYCSKADSRAPGEDRGPYEFGPRPPGQGQRTDLCLAVDAVLQSRSLDTLITDHASSFVKYSSGFYRLLGHIQAPRTTVPRVEWYSGGTGTGKSRWALANGLRHLHGDDWQRALDDGEFTGIYWKMGSNKWWDGYTQQRVVIIDDYRCDLCPFSYLLKLIDRYPFLVEVKGGTVQFNSELIMFTAPMGAREMWQNRSQEDLNQLIRRISLFRDFNMFPYNP